MRIACPLLICTLLMPAAAFADARDDVVAGMARCGRIADDRQWLECLYGAAQPMRAKLGLPPAPESQQMLSRTQGAATASASVAPRSVAAPPPASVTASVGPGAGFGLPRAGSNANESGRIAAFSFDPYGIFTVTLTNGQVWRQNSSDSTKARWSVPPSRMAYNVVISEGILGSYDFKVIGMPGTYKVRRIK
ncbi:MAG: hypothetical protein JO256_06435 [Alphaproteobacteria bacterium]|nr:hypothetical protein [Alphaproteobacteria bacterium]